MIKCDFCKCYNAAMRRCMGSTGTSYCDEAGRRFLSFQRSRNTRTHTKNINVNKKSYNKKSYGKKR